MKPWQYSLRCRVQKYEWGNRNGIIQDLLRSAGEETDDAPAAELWMGAHTSASSVLPDGRTLDRAIREDPFHFLGSSLARRNHRSLPFLFKILDASRPLSIQAHPDRELAAKLHASDPEHYPDANHKPELAVCLEGMEALIGFRRVGEIASFLKIFPGLAKVAAPQITHGDEKAWVKAKYAALMTDTPEEIAQAVQSVLASSYTGSELPLFRKLVELYGEKDPGCLSVFFLNHVRLKHGQALFLGPNEPHAYLEGRILECMAESDNVVRAGLTSKFRDTQTLLSMLTYETGPAKIVEPVFTGSSVNHYEIPVNDFTVEKITPNPARGASLRADRPAIYITMSGTAMFTARDSGLLSKKSLGRGSVLFVPGDLQDRNLQLSITGSAGSEVWRASVHRDY